MTGILKKTTKTKKAAAPKTTAKAAKTVEVKEEAVQPAKPAAKEKTKILFAASESVPFIKTGGLADVVGTLPKYISKRKYDVRVILPKYTCIPEKWQEKMNYITNFQMDYRGGKKYVGLFEMVHDGITFYFVDNLDYFCGEKPYTDALYDLEKFAFFSKAVLSSLPILGFQPDIIHCHDWQTGLIPVLVKGHFAGDAFFWGMKTVMTIHNLKFQGVWDIDTIKSISELDDSYFTYDKLEAYGDGNMLKGGIVYADKVTTVSPTYAKEITEPYYGEGLDGLMRSKGSDVLGILNGIDYKDFDPENDHHVAAPFSAEFFEGKAANKAAIQKELGLPEDPDALLIGVVSRLTDQKGFDLIKEKIEEIIAGNTQLIVLGTGDAFYEGMFRAFAERYPEKVSANITYSEELSHKIYAGCDAFLMPSRFEPCGLSQMMSMRYGTLPIVRETGGLKDSVDPYNEYENKGTGFSFSTYNSDDMIKIINYAKAVFAEDKEGWVNMAKRAMITDFSWKASAKNYERMYDSWRK